MCLHLNNFLPLWVPRAAATFEQQKKAQKLSFMEQEADRYRICKAAIQLFSEAGFEATPMAAIAGAAGLTEDVLYRYFGSKTDILLFLYQSINTDWQRAVDALPQTRLAPRFEAALLAKIEIIEPYAAVLSNMLGLLLLAPKMAPDAPETAHIRTLGLQTITKIITGATDAKTLEGKIRRLPSMLYMLHWLVLFLHLKTHSREKTTEAIKMMAQALKKTNSFAFALSLFPFVNEVSTWADNLLNENVPLHHSINRAIFKIIANNRKISAPDANCTGPDCETCFQLHEASIAYFVGQNQPIHFILPAFPAKSPNQNKVLGTLPDLGEEIALTTLENLCQEIKSIYPPGATITICTDGRIFSELVEVTDERVTAYVAEIKTIITNQNLRHLRIVNLEDLMAGDSFSQMREQVLATYAEPLEQLRANLKQSTEFRHLFDGMHRFISEDRKALYPALSATRVKEESKTLALRVIQHSNAWTRFLLYVFPNAIRLSIHPYSSHSRKIGIQLTKAANNWITPWHGVIVLDKDGYVLMKKEAAEALGARLVAQHNRPYYYTLIPR